MLCGHREESLGRPSCTFSLSRSPTPGVQSSGLSKTCWSPASCNPQLAAWLHSNFSRPSVATCLPIVAGVRKKELSKFDWTQPHCMILAFALRKQLNAGNSLSLLATHAGSSIISSLQTQLKIQDVRKQPLRRAKDWGEGSRTSESKPFPGAGHHAEAAG